MASKPLPVHKDKLGQDLDLGDCVAFPDSNTLFIGKVIKLHPKLVTVVKLGGLWQFETRKYPGDLIKLESDKLTFYLLRH